MAGSTRSARGGAWRPTSWSPASDCGSSAWPASRRLRCPEWIFTLTDDARLLAIARATGRVRWITQLQHWKNPKKESGPIFWTGPVLANNRLWVASSEGHVLSADVATGTTAEFADLNKPVSLPPIVANRTLYILDDSGRITAWR